jgi:hypothetical protein
VIGDSAAHDIAGAHAVGARSACLRRGRAWPEKEQPPSLVVETFVEAVGLILDDSTTSRALPDFGHCSLHRSPMTPDSRPFSKQRSGVWPEQPSRSSSESAASRICLNCRRARGLRPMPGASEELRVARPSPDLTESGLVRTGQVCCEGFDRLPPHLGHSDDARTNAEAGPLSENGHPEADPLGSDRREVDAAVPHLPG